MQHGPVDCSGQYSQCRELASGQLNQLSGAIDGIELIRRAEVELNAVQDPVRGQQIRGIHITCTVQTIAREACAVSVDAVQVVLRGQVHGCAGAAGAGDRARNPNCPSLVPMKTYWRFPQQRDHPFARHARLDREQVLTSQSLLTLPGNLTTFLPVARGKHRVGCEEQEGQQRQNVDPKAAPREERLLHFQADDSLDLCPPELCHRTTSSFPIRYS